MESSRRSFTKWTVGMAALLATSSKFPHLQALIKSASGGNPLHIPSAFTGNSFTIEKKMNTVWPGAPLTEIFSLTGNYLGPLLKIKKGETLTINVKNTIANEVTIHFAWNGIPCEDGRTPDRCYIQTLHLL